MQWSMHILYPFFALCSRFPRALTSVIPPFSSLGPESAFSNQSSTISNSSTYLLNEPHYLCSGDLYRRNLQQRSCINALTTISRSSEVVTFGPRSAPAPFHVELPFRWISGTYEHAIRHPKVAAYQCNGARRRWALCLRHLHWFG